MLTCAWVHVVVSVARSSVVVVIAGKAISVALNAHHARGEKAAADRPIWSVSTVVAITQIE